MENEKQLIIRENELSVSDVKHQVNKIQDLMKEMMIDGEHFGEVPGTKKKTLLKAGAEKLGLMFRLMPDLSVERIDMPGGHREFIIVCTLKHIQTGQVVGQGVGSCSTMESKYRWREDRETEEVGDIPPGYWKIDRDNHSARTALLNKTFGSGNLRAKKTADGWKVIKITGTGQKIENPDIADTYNTVFKMAKKRALVDATITACAASDIFTQDVEEMDEQSGGTSSSSGDTPQKGTRKPELPEEVKQLANALYETIITLVKDNVMEKAEGGKWQEEIKKAAYISRRSLEKIETDINNRISELKPADFEPQAEELDINDPGINNAFDTSGGTAGDAPIY